MGFRNRLVSEKVPKNQRFLAFLDRTVRIERRLKRTIALLTLGFALGLLVGTPEGRFASLSFTRRLEWSALRAIGREPDREEVDALWDARRRRGIRQTDRQLRTLYQDAGEPLQTLLRDAGMAPGAGLLRWANYDRTLLFSARVFSTDDQGRSYRLRPNTRSVWLRQERLAGSPFGLFLVPDAPEIRADARRAGAMIVGGSEQTTNSWGCRGPEPDLSATLRGIVLGDSFMQGLFIGDDEPPPVRLQRTLAAECGHAVCVLNTGHFGYSPEQYFHTLREYGDRFRPHFVIVSLCPNDFGDGLDVMKGKGDWAEARYWLGEIQRHCRERDVLCVFAPVPCDVRLEGERLDGHYPGQIVNVCGLDSLTYCNPFDDFVNEHLRLVGEGRLAGTTYPRSPLYNRHIGDGHFSALGADVWGRALALRITLLLASRSPGAAEPRRLASRPIWFDAPRLEWFSRGSSTLGPARIHPPQPPLCNGGSKGAGRADLGFPPLQRGGRGGSAPRPLTSTTRG